MLTNKTNLSMSLAVALSYNDYDYINEPNYISATGLLKPIKSIILTTRIKQSKEADVQDMVASVLGSSFHARAEQAFLPQNLPKVLKQLGYNENIISRIKVNPKDPHEADLPIYMEKRTIKDIAGYSIGGKMDFVNVDGAVEDFKTTKTFSWVKQDFQDYIVQLSIYKWLNQDIITQDYGVINFIFTDWKQYEANANPNYPQHSALSHTIKLLSNEETQTWLETKLAQITLYMDSDENSIPECNSKELWRDETKFAFYSKPDSKRATKVSTDQALINQLYIDKGSVGKVETRLGKVKRCTYCQAAEVCLQHLSYISQELV